jgi:DNA-binding FadR family transcriptional regulator
MGTNRKTTGRTAIFSEVRRGRVFESVVEQIQNVILDGRLRAGDKLPPERKLVEMFHTSRGTLREALRVVEHKGLVEIRTGVQGGAVVKESNARQLDDGVALLLRQQKVSIADVAEFREGVEGIVSGLAARRATTGDVRCLKGILEEARAGLEAARADWGSFIELDNRLHMALASIAGNPVYEIVLRSVHDNIKRYYDELLPRTRRTMRQNYADLCAIVQSVQDHDAVSARERAQAHVERFSRLMRKGGSI